jgi:hypothetical protein
MVRAACTGTTMHVALFDAVPMAIPSAAFFYRFFQLFTD